MLLQPEPMDYDRVCNLPHIREQIVSVEEKRRSGLRAFLLLLLAAIGAAVAAFFILNAIGWTTFGFFAASVLFFFGVVLAYAPLARTAKGLKGPFLEGLASRSGMEYFADEFVPPLYAEAKKALFGSWISSESFTDLFNGTDEHGNGEAIYEGNLQRRSGKSSHTVFSGQFYALQRARPTSGVTVIVPDRGLFNFFKPARGMERVSLTDEAFEKKFEVYSTSPDSARNMLFDSALRALLLELREAGKIFVYAGREGVLIAVTGKDRFEPGSMFRSKSGDERTRLMFDDFCASLALLRRLKERFR